MNQLITTGIILRRTDYGEADRIILLLTPDKGKLSLVAKGVRRIKSKLAGGVELFSVSQITFLAPRTGSGLGTLVSARLQTHYSHIVEDIDRTMLGYELIKQLDKATEDNPEPEYFELLQQTFIALDDRTISLPLIRVWLNMQLLRLAGHTPNLHTDSQGDALSASRSYEFSFEDMAFFPQDNGRFGPNHIKFLRLGFGRTLPKALHRVTSQESLIAGLQPLLETLIQASH